MQGLRVVDLTRVLAGPWATQQLADQGALVVKVEPPDGDETRRFGPVVAGESTYFVAANRNKRSIVLDLRRPEAREVLGRLIARADVLVENYRPGVAERLGFGWEAVRQRHPRLVYVAIHAFGDDGDPAWVGRPGYDLVLQALGGGASTTGFPGAPPIKHSLSIADLLSGLAATQAILFGLLHRERTGEGQKIVVDMMQIQAAALAYHATRFTVTGEVETQRGNAHRALVPYDLYRCSDGWLAVACGNDAIWTRLRRALDLPDRAEWRTNADRISHREDVDEAVKRALGGRTVQAADAALAQAGVPAGPVLTMDQTLAHPAVELVEVAHPTLGRIRLPGPLVRTATTRTEHSPPPRLGEHRDQILAELGYDHVAIAALEAAIAFGDVRRA
jgi:crotonobetainyl-CoA:carnitine CoA-transferase CaiB-like acyl-CoA transferase